MSETLTIEVEEPEAPVEVPGEMPEASEETFGHKILRFLRGMLGLGS